MNRRIFSMAFFTLLLALAGGTSALAQPQLDVTFRFLPDLTPPPIQPVRAFLPGSFNDWGPNSNGQIAIDAPSRMTYVPVGNEYRYTIPLTLGQTYTYKVHYHLNQSGTNYVWISDPLNPVTTGPNNDSVIEIADPMTFQLAREQNPAGQLFAVSASLFGTAAFTSVQFQVNDGSLQDGLAFFDAETGLFRYELPAPVAAPGYFRIIATDALGRTVEDETGVIPPTVTDAARPAGLEDGITVVDGSTVRLSLFAPGKSFVHVLGDFNDWTVDDDALLFRDAEGEDPATADSVWWWTEISGLTPGEEIAFQYLVNGETRIADPYSPKVLLPEDSGISPATYPDLRPYPTEAAGKPATAITPGATPYVWQIDNFERPAQEDLVIYELLVRDFLQAHDYDTLADTLAYLDRLGVNAIELMPVAEFGGNINWGYQPTFHLALDKYYGPADQFKAFVDAAHARGIAVLLDVVYNHADSPSPLVELYGCTEAGLYTNNPARHPFNVFCDLDHTNPATQHWLDRANRWWMEEYRVDGYRFDLAGGFMQDGNFFGYNPQRVGLFERMADVLWAFDDEAIIILEDLIDSDQEYRELAQYGRDEGRPGMMLWHHMNREYSQSAMGYPTATDFPSTLTETYPPSWVSAMPVGGAVTYMESHDEQWMMFRNLNYGNSNPATGYDIADLGTALERQKLAGTFFFPVPGARMMWQFGELGYGGGPGECLVNGDYPGECPNGVPGRTSPKPIRWNYYHDPDRRNLYDTWAALINLRTDYAVFTSPDTEVDTRLGLVPDRWITLSLPDAPDGEPSEVVIVGNFGVTPREVAVDFPATGTWYGFFGDTELAVTETAQTFSLQPGEARIYTNVDVPSPASGIYTVDAEDVAGTPDVFRLDAAYPNPFAETTTFTYALPTPADVRVEVVDVLGRRVAVLVDETQTAGEHRIALRGADLPSGTYLVRLTASGHTATTKVTLAR